MGLNNSNLQNNLQKIVKKQHRIKCVILHTIFQIMLQLYEALVFTTILQPYTLTGCQTIIRINKQICGTDSQLINY